MKNTEILREMTEIEDRYIEEAAVGSLESSGSEHGMVKANRKRKRIWKVVGTIAACMVLIVGSYAALFGTFRMGKANDAADQETINDGVPNYGGVSGYNYVAEQDRYVDDEAVFNEAQKASFEGWGESENSGIENAKSNAKLIYTADISIQTIDYEAEYAKLKAMVEKYGGYFESSNVYNGGYYEDKVYKNANFTVRIPQEKYNDFLNGINTDSHVVNISENVKNVGEQYYELETRLQTLYTKVNRLQELLSKAENVSEIIEIESALQQTEYEIDLYKSDLNRYDGLIGYSTFNIEIYEVERYSGELDEPSGFFGNIAKSFIRGIKNFGYGVSDFVMWCAYNFIALIIIIAAIVVICKFHLIRKIRERIRR